MERTAFGSSAAARSSSRAVAGDLADGGRPIDTTAGRIWDGDSGFSRLFAADFNPRNGGGGSVVGVLRRRWPFTFVRARALAVTTGRVSGVCAPGRRAAIA